LFSMPSSFSIVIGYRASEPHFGHQPRECCASAYMHLLPGGGHTRQLGRLALAREGLAKPARNERFHEITARPSGKWRRMVASSRNLIQARQQTSQDPLETRLINERVEGRVRRWTPAPMGTGRSTWFRARQVNSSFGSLRRIHG
jgi:hypothetical protein